MLGCSSGWLASSSDWLGCRMEMLGCSLDSLVSSSGSSENRMVKWGSRMGWSVNMMGLLASSSGL